MPTALAQRPHTDAVIAAVAAAGVAVGDGIRNTLPDGKGERIPPPCAIVNPIPGGRRYGTVDDWTVNADLVYQVTCVGATRAQAEQVRDIVEAALFVGITVDGRHIELMRVDFGSDGATRDDSEGDSLWTCRPRFRFSSTPQTG